MKKRVQEIWVQISSLVKKIWENQELRYANQKYEINLLLLLYYL